MKLERKSARRLAVARLVPLLALALALLLVPAAVWGQQVTAAILGRVSDANDAPVGNARVTATDTARGTVWTAETNSDGIFNLPRVPAGGYEVRVEARGFKAAVRQSVQLEINQTARVDLKLEIGELTETVNVTSDAPLLQSDTSQIGTVIDSKTNVELPLGSRYYVQLTLLSPGSVNPNPESIKNGGGRPYINGNREQANNFLLDGIDNNQVSDNLVGYTPAPDAIQEFNLITSNASAEFGQFQGGIVNVTLKSGTNQYHGNLYEFFRNDVLNANTWSNKFNGIDREKLRYNQFGGTFGGPIMRDKLFVFADYQGSRFSRPASTGSITVFTLAERQGDFSALLQKGIQLYNPFQLDASGKRVPFVNNRIPLSLLDPVAKSLFSSQYYPAPTNGDLQNNQLNTSSSHTNSDQGDVKIDYNYSSKDHIFGRYSQNFTDSPSINTFPLFFNTFNRFPVYSGVADWTRTINPGLVNEVRFGINYVKLHNGGVDNGLGKVAESLGIQNGNDRAPGLFGLNFSAGFVNGFGNSNIGTQQLFADTVIQLEDSLIITTGRHIFHTGFQYKRQRVNTFYAGNYGGTGFMDFTGRFTAGPDPLSVAGSTGAGEADFFLGLPAHLGRGVNTGTWGQRGNLFAGYFQDDWRVNDRLTLNLGLRYETQTPWVEIKDRQVNFGPISGELQCAGKGRPDLGCNSPATIYGNNRALYNPTNWSIGNFQPRIGFAWTPALLGRNTVLRGAYTISSYLEGTGTNLRLPLNPPFTTEFYTNYDNLTLPGSRTGQGLTVLQSASDPFAGAVIRLWDPNVRPAVVQQWNLSVQHQFNNTMTLQVGYVGQHGTHLMVPMPYFQRRLLGRNPDGTIATAPSPYLSGNPALKGIAQISGTESNGNMRYDALQAVFQKRLGGGLQFQVAYTFSKAMSNSSGYYGSWGGQTIPTSPYWQNLYDGRAEWAPSFFDAKHVLTGYALYELPVGRGKKYGADLNQAVNALVGNWQVTGIFTFRGGFPLSIGASDASGTGSRGSRADCVGHEQVFGKRTVPGVLGYLWFDPTAYAAPAPGTFGSCAPATVRGPGLRVVDLGLQKRFSITERTGVEFRSEFINFTNTPILTAPNTGLGASLGQLQGSQGPRNIQFALKLFF